jgi:fumarate hydratase class II
LEYRTETDSHGEVLVPAEAYYGAQTARALTNFPIGEDRMPSPLIHALGLVKQCAAEAHLMLGTLNAEQGDLIVQAATEVAGGHLDDQFPLPVWQTGSGTQTNMNANEVIAGRANELAGRPRGGKEPVHPNDHVNLGQSSNDVIPTALHLAAVTQIDDLLLPALEELLAAFRERQIAFGDVIKIGRTHLMDAVPLTMGQEISGWAHQIAAGRDRVRGTLDGLFELVLGGTAVGTCLNAPPGFADESIRRLAEATGQPFRRAHNRFAAQGSHDAMVATSGALRGLAVALIKIAGDVRLLASGPRCGLGELRLPANEPGSSIMPGKVNPTQTEALHMVCAQVIGHDAAIGVGGMSGHLQLNANKPLLAHCLLHQIRLLADSCLSFSRRCIARMEPDREMISRHLDRSLMLVTALVPHIGYDRAAQAAEKAFDENTTLREAVLELDLLTAEEFDAAVNPEAMTGPENQGVAK